MSSTIDVSTEAHWNVLQRHDKGESLKITVELGMNRKSMKYWVWGRV